MIITQASRLPRYRIHAKRPVTENNRPDTSVGDRAEQEAV